MKVAAPAMLPTVWLQLRHRRLQQLWRKYVAKGVAVCSKSVGGL
jgi:hypothetical protein